MGPLSPRLNKPILPAVPTMADKGAIPYWGICLSCHGDKGQGLTDEWRQGGFGLDMNCWKSKCHAPNHPTPGFTLPRLVPAIIGPNTLHKVLQALSKLNLAVRGLYGEGTQASGNFFQFSNQITLGQPEDEIISNLEGVIRQVITHEREAREYLKKKRKAKMEDQIWRALAALKAARMMSSSEAIQLLSLVQVGIDVGVLEGQVTHTDLNQLFLLIQPAHLQKMNGKELGATERDARRASRIREYFSKVVL